ncbi:MAG: endonuclease/exonuclease/phosphatase family protein [Planctomycetales bacterium]|nr:endonuclease/exonuclease/phosphatase family protein [Planctomycetales bacterium]
MITRWSARWRRIRRKLSPTEWFVRWFRLPTSPSTAQDRGLILIQIDGLSRRELERAVARGQMPFVKSLLDREQYVLHDFYSGLPSSTPSVQGELFYGERCAVPAFGFRDHRTGRIVRMFARDASAEVEKRLQSRGPGVLRHGSAYCNIYSGEASEAYFCASSLGLSDVMRMVHPGKMSVLVLWHVGSLLRAAGLAMLEFFLALGGFLSRQLSRREAMQELMMIPARVVVVILMRELTTIGATIDAVRGLPIIQLNYLGYDEQAHRRGPASHFAHWPLKGIDAAMRRLWRIAHASDRRDYDVWIYADHGQEATRPYEYVAGEPLQEIVSQVVRQVCGDGRSVAPPVRRSGRSGQSMDHHSGHRRGHHTADRARWLSAGWLVGKLFGEVEPPSEHLDDHVQVAAVGPLGLIYTNRMIAPAERREVAWRMVRDHHIPLAFVAMDSQTVLALTPDGEFALPEHAVAVFGADHPFVADVAHDMVRLVRHPDSGDIVVSGWSHDSESLSFVRQHGAHAGPGPSETGAFALIPNDVVLPAEEHGYLRPNELRLAIELFLGRSDPGGPRRNAGVRRRVAIKPGRAPEKRFLRLMTYNVHACIGMDGMLSPARIARVIAQSGADVVGLQELDVQRARTGFRDQALDIARQLEMECQFHPSWSVEEERYGNAILSHFPLQHIDWGQLPASHMNREPRGVLWCEIDLGQGARLQVLNTHLSLYPQERSAQAMALVSDWTSLASQQGPTVLCGDFNAHPKSQSYRVIAERLIDAHLTRQGGPTNTWFSPRPLARIDHVFVNADVYVDHATVIDSRLARVASDHLPLVADLHVLAHWEACTSG